MKKYYTTPEYKIYNLRRAKDRHKRNREYRKWRKLRNKEKIGISRKKYREKKLISKYTLVEAPLKFSFIHHLKESIDFLNKLEKFYEKRKKVFINLSDVKFLDYTAVTVLVSIMFSFKTSNIDINGNFPNDPNLKIMLLNSGFLKYINKPIIEKRIEYKIGKENQIFTRANRKVNPELGLLVMKETSQTVWNENRVCKGLQRVLLELMQNTNNHAVLNKKGEKHWWLSVNHDKPNNKVSFVFVDYGIGIFSSLKNKPTDNKWFGWIEKISHKLTYEHNFEVLKMLLEGELHMTVTGQPFRGKGLPGIKQVFDRNQISSLYILSNDVFSDIDKNLYVPLENNFSGTLVYWEINKSNVSLPWNI